MATAGRVIKRRRSRVKEPEQEIMMDTATGEENPSDMDQESLDGQISQNISSVRSDLEKIACQVSGDSSLDPSARPPKRDVHELTDNKKPDSEHSPKKSKICSGNQMDTGTGEKSPTEADRENYCGESSQAISATPVDLGQTMGQANEIGSDAILEGSEKQTFLVVSQHGEEQSMSHSQMLESCTGERVDLGQSSVVSSLKQIELLAESRGVSTDSNGSRFFGKIAEIRALMHQFSNLNGCNLQGVRCDTENDLQNLSVSQKTVVFDLQRELFEMFKFFQLVANHPETTDLTQNMTSSIEKLKLVLKNWKSIGFFNLTQEQFIIDEQMEEVNGKCNVLISEANLDFLVFLDENISLVDLLYLHRIANALCVSNFSLEFAFEDDFNDPDA